jgi:hypothetical protein
MTEIKKELQKQKETTEKEWVYNEYTASQENIIYLWQF